MKSIIVLVFSLACGATGLAAMVSSEWMEMGTYVFIDVEDGVEIATSRCQSATCPDSGIVLRPGGFHGRYGCPLPTTCCAHFNCALLLATDAVCCDVGQSCTFVDDPIKGPTSYCTYIE